MSDLDIDAIRERAGRLDEMLAEHPDGECPPLCDVGGDVVDDALALCAELRSVREELAATRRAIQAVRDIHKPVTVTSGGGTMTLLVPARSMQCRRCFGDMWHPFGSYPCQELAAIAAAVTPKETGQ